MFKKADAHTLWYVTSAFSIFSLSLLIALHL